MYARLPKKEHHTADALFAALRHVLGTSKCAYEKLLKTHAAD